MSHIRLNIDKLVLNGFGPGEAKALTEALRTHLHQVLSNQANREQWARPHRTPVLKLGRLPLPKGPDGAGKFGRELARAVGKGMKP